MDIDRAGPAVLLQDLGFSRGHALEAAYTVGLIGVVLIVAGLYRLGREGHAGVGGDCERVASCRRQFVHSLVPIALAYVVAHYCSVLVYQGQALAYLVSDPLGDGSDYLRDRRQDDRLRRHLAPTAIWYVQVGALVIGHAAGLVLAHDRALRRLQARPRRDAVAVLDARRHGRLHEPRPLAVERAEPMITLAHAGHWLVGSLYLVPVVILVGVLFVQGRRDRRAEAAEAGQEQDQKHA